MTTLALEPAPAPQPSWRSRVAACIRKRANLYWFDRLFLPRVQAAHTNTQSVDLLVRARLIVAVVLLSMVGLAVYLNDLDGHTVTSVALRLVAIAVETGFVFALRFVHDPTRLGKFLGIVLILETWVLLPFGSGAELLTAGTTQLQPIIIGLCSGMEIGMVSAVSSVVYAIVLWELDVSNTFNFPVTSQEETLREYMMTRCVYLTVYAAVLAVLYSTLHMKRLAQLSKLNAELQIAVKEARLAADSRSAFVATMSHEIRTPLNGILGMAQVLAQSDLTPRQQGEVSMLQTCGENLLGIVNDVLDMAKITANKVELEIGPMRLHTVVERCLTIVGVRAAHLRVHLAYDSRALEGCPVYAGDGNRLQQVVLNLLTNAIKFTTPGGWVSVTAQVKPQPAGGDLVSLHVTDTGCGIPADRLDAVFEAFVQSDVTVVRKHGGTGLGLTISRSLVRLMGGELRVASTFGVGSTFSIDLPLTSVAPAVKVVLAPLDDSASRPLSSVLLLDTAPDSVGGALLQNQLKAARASVTLASDINAANEALNKTRPDALLLNAHPFTDESSAAAALTWLASVAIPAGTHLIVTTNTWLSTSPLETALRHQRPGIIWLTQPVVYRALVAALGGRQLEFDGAPTRETSTTEELGSHDSATAHGDTPRLPATLEEAHEKIDDDEEEEDSEVGSSWLSGPPSPDEADDKNVCSSLRVATPNTLTSALSSFTADVEAPSGAKPAPVPTPAASRPVSSPAAAAERMHCLLVDDNKVNQQVVVRLLAALGHTCEVANDGLEAIERVRARLALPGAELYSIVLMDLHMPGMTGQQATQHIRDMAATDARISDLYIVAASADALQSTQNGCMDLGFDAFLPKPFLIGQLKAILAGARAKKSRPAA